MHGSNNTKHPPSRPFRQSARDPREVVHWLRPATTRVRTATLRSARSARLCPIIHHYHHQQPSPTGKHHHRLAASSVAINTSHRTSPACSAGVFVASRSGAERPFLSLHLPSFALTTRPSSIFAETLRPPANTIVSPTSALYRQPCQQHMVSHSTVCHPEPTPPSPSPSGPAALTLSHPIQFHHMLTFLASNL